MDIVVGQTLEDKLESKLEKVTPVWEIKIEMKIINIMKH